MSKVIIACDSFKESMTALEACEAVRHGIERTGGNFEMVVIPMADGGEGTCDVLSYVLPGEFHTVTVHGPLGNDIEAKYYTNRNRSILEVAAACGIGLVPKEKRNPMHTSSYGVGEMLLVALDHSEDIYIGLGGSSTNDAGLGMLRALGGEFYDSNQRPITDVKDLIHLDSMDLSKCFEKLVGHRLIVMSDVDNPFIGEHGATYTFGPQKGADAEQLEYLEKCLTRFNEVAKKTYGIDLASLNKTGAAGGLGGAFYLLGAEMKSGINTILELTDFENQVRNADYVVTGEGSIDFQTTDGKTISGILKLAKKYDVPVIALAGRVTDNIFELYEMGLTSAFSIVNEAKSLEQALKDGYASLECSAYNIFRLLK